MRAQALSASPSHLEALTRRFLVSFSPEPTSGCWLWTGPAHKKWNGYGSTHVGRKVITAHRGAWLVFRGPIPEGMLICHKCDLRCCVNPEHLFLGTSKDNAQDAMRKARNPHCETHGMAKFTWDQVREIRRIYRHGHNCQTICDRFGGDVSNIQLIVKHRTWRKHAG